jgi:hypothetical protein
MLLVLPCVQLAGPRQLTADTVSLRSRGVKRPDLTAGQTAAV